MTEEIKLGVHERLLNDYESDKEKYAADLAYAACCLVDTVRQKKALNPMRYFIHDMPGMKWKMKNLVESLSVKYTRLFAMGKL